jgi:hypothetical protein
VGVRAIRCWVVWTWVLEKVKLREIGGTVVREYESKRRSGISCGFCGGGGRPGREGSWRTLAKERSGGRRS